ncbi:uncharacterized protein [Ptychodera flava]|uniref:uncharacterized protein isoform X2 n=1 Tax=Ptychodera flava TaxID=63121 RepID=UPI00396A84AD
MSRHTETFTSTRSTTTQQPQPLTTDTISKSSTFSSYFSSPASTTISSLSSGEVSTATTTNVTTQQTDFSTHKSSTLTRSRSTSTQQPHPSTTDKISQSSSVSSYFSTPISTTSTPSSGEVSRATPTGISTLQTVVSTHKDFTPTTTQQSHPSTNDEISKSSTFSSYLSTHASTTISSPSSWEVGTATTANVSTLQTDVSTHKAITFTWSRSTTSSLTSMKLETPATTEQSSAANSIIVFSVVGVLPLLIVALILGAVLLWCRRQKRKEGQDANSDYVIPAPAYQTETVNVSSLPISADHSGYTDLLQGNRLLEHAYQSLTPRSHRPHGNNHQLDDSYTELRAIPVSPYQSLDFTEQAFDHVYTELTYDNELTTHEYEELKID